MTIDEYVKLVLFAKSDVYASCKDNIELPKVLEADEYLMLNTLFNIHSIYEISHKVFDEIYKNHLVIGEDALGNYILLNQASGKIVYWDTNYAYTSPKPNNVLNEFGDYDDDEDHDMNAYNVIELSDSLSEFLTHVSIK